MRILKTISIATTALLLTSCEAFTSFEDFQENPNETTFATPGLLLTNLEISVFNSINLNAGYASRYLIEVNRPLDSQYYTWDRGNFGFYNSLLQTVKMHQEADRLENGNMIAISNLLRIYIFHEITRRFGDVPYFNALQGEELEFQPQYDPQEEIYIDLLLRLDDVNSQLDVNGSTVQGDVVFNGDVLKWKKFVNSLKLRILISLSEKENTSIDYESQFQQIINNPGQYPIMQSIEDNVQYEYSEATGNSYPFYTSASFTSRFLTETIVNLYKDREDPRLFTIGAPDNAAEEGDEFSFDSYSGLISSNSTEDNNTLLGQGVGSQLNARYVEDPEAEPNLAMSYAEVSFIIAEAAQRGWVSVDPTTYYQNGIRASMRFYNIDEASIDAYLQNENVVFNPTNGLEMILLQKYMAMFLNSGWEPFYNQRRTGIPVFDVGTGDNLLNDGQVPNRWMYPEDEINTNRENAIEAIDRQFQGNDNINGKIWIN